MHVSESQLKIILPLGTSQLEHLWIKLDTPIQVIANLGKELETMLHKHQTKRHGFMYTHKKHKIQYVMAKIK